MVLRAIEHKIEALVEGVFGRAFRTNVQPVELARKLAKEMDDHRQVSVSRVYVPNEYTIYLSPGDREQFEGYEQSLVGELQEYLSEHARRETYALMSAPKVLLETDDDLEVGEFGIATRMVQQERRREEAAEEPEPIAKLDAGDDRDDGAHVGHAGLRAPPRREGHGWVRGLRQARRGRARGLHLHRHLSPAGGRGWAQAPLRRRGAGGRSHDRPGHP